MFKQILNYQEKEKELIAIEKELSGSEERKRVGRAKSFLNDVDVNIAPMDEKAEVLRGNFEKLSKKAVVLEKELTEYNNLLENTSGDDEVNYFLSKIDQLEEQIQQVEKDIAQINSDIKQLLVSFDDYRKKVKQARDEFDVYKKKYDAMKLEKKPAMDAIKAELAKLGEGIDKGLLEQYKKIRERKIFPAIVPLTGENCGGCRMELSMNGQSELKTKKIIECEECGRLIYIAD